MKKTELFIVIGAFVLSTSIVFGVLFFLNRKDYSGAVAKIDEVLASRDAVSSFLRSGIDDLAEFDTQKIESYKSTIQETKSKLEVLENDRVCKDEAIKERCSALSESFAKLEKTAENTEIISKFVAESQDVAGVSSDTLNEMKNSSNDFLKNFGTDLSEYLNLVDEFKAKYVGNADDTDYVADYTVIDEKYNDLLDKYSDIDYSKLYGSSDEELLSFYDKLEELKATLAEK